MIRGKPSELENFDVDKYAALENFGPEKWGHLIESRIVCERIITAKRQFAKSENDSANPFAWTAELLIKHLLDTPLTPFNQALRNSRPRAEQPAPSVTPLRVSEIFALHRAAMETAPIAVSIQNDEIEYWTSGEEHLQLFDTPIDDAIAQSKLYNIRTLARFQIDLQASDKQIVGDLKKLLSSYRKRTSFAPPPITEAKLNQWFRNRVLPYTDLKLWAQWSNANLKNKDFFELIFSVEEEVTNHPLDSTRRDYADAISSTTVAALLHSSPSPNKK